MSEIENMFIFYIVIDDMYHDISAYIFTLTVGGFT